MSDLRNLLIEISKRDDVPVDIKEKVDEINNNWDMVILDLNDCADEIIENWGKDKVLSDPGFYASEYFNGYSEELCQKLENYISDED
jgi:hypothetical protein